MQCSSGSRLGGGAASPTAPPVIGTLAVKRWVGCMLRLVQQGGDWAERQPAQAPPRCTKRISPPINGQCTNFILFDVAL